jgi:endoglucanase
MKWISLLFFLNYLQQVQAQPNPIRIDQEGYYPQAPKIAVLVLSPSQEPASFGHATTFYVTSHHGQDTVFIGDLSYERNSTNSSLRTRVADFSSLKTTGTFQVVIGKQSSYPFRIQEKVHGPMATASLKAFYYQRSSMTLDSVYAGQWSRVAGHPDTAVIIHPSAATAWRKAGSTISTPGGWYDAGDYNKYMVNSGITTATLLSAYEDFKPYFDTLQTHIPPGDKPLPDILTEVLYNLRWMLSMQDPGDGGAYNKCTNASFDGMEMPALALEPRYVVQKGTAATLDLAAVASQAARIFSSYQKELPGLSDSCRTAAEKAWQWCIVHPNMAYDQQAMNLLYEPKISTGGYGDKQFSDEWFWAASELFILTGGKNYKDSVQRGMNQSFGLPSWSQTGLLGYYSLLRSKGNHLSTIQEDSIRRRLIRMADDDIRLSERNAFLTVMGGRKSDFVWGSNANAANQGVLLIEVYRLTQNPKYLDAALGNLDYLCGRNATGYCFVTGFGSYSPLHPHHRPSVADGIAAPIPGLLVGGPNPGEQDHSHYDFHEPETAYVDIASAYASNEIAINWNAPLVYLASAVETLFTTPH